MLKQQLRFWQQHRQLPWQPRCSGASSIAAAALAAWGRKQLRSGCWVAGGRLGGWWRTPLRREV